MNESSKSGAETDLFVDLRTGDLIVGDKVK